jgi:Ca2+-binding RTX toxin-like protein
MRSAAVGLLAIVLVSLTSVLSAANSVPVSHAVRSSNTIGANTLKPTACASLTLTALVTGSGLFSGTNASELILGSSGTDTILASGGDDCVVGGGGNDLLNGGAGTDVCDGGPGLDVFDPSCETQIQ